MKKVKVGIVGGSGYTGIELLRLLAQHPHAEIVTITGFGTNRLAHDGAGNGVPDTGDRVKR